LFQLEEPFGLNDSARHPFTALLNVVAFALRPTKQLLGETHVLMLWMRSSAAD
jgi:hypothetical protein